MLHSYNIGKQCEIAFRMFCCCSIGHRIFIYTSELFVSHLHNMGQNSIKFDTSELLGTTMLYLHDIEQQCEKMFCCSLMGQNSA